MGEMSAGYIHRTEQEDIDILLSAILSGDTNLLLTHMKNGVHLQSFDPRVTSPIIIDRPHTIMIPLIKTDNTEMMKIVCDHRCDPQYFVLEWIAEAVIQEKANIVYWMIGYSNSWDHRQVLIRRAVATAIVDCSSVFSNMLIERYYPGGITQDLIQSVSRKLCDTGGWDAFFKKLIQSDRFDDVMRLLPFVTTTEIVESITLNIILYAAESVPKTNGGC